MVSCNQRRNENAVIVVPDRQSVEEANRYLVQKDRERIENYIERRGLDMQMSSSGLWYMITDTGSGDTIRENDRVSLRYNCNLLDGSEVYSSAERGLMEVFMGRTAIEAGLDEGLRLLRGGGEAVFIIPSYLGHGLLGDGEKIPPRSVLVYRIRVIRHNGKEY